MLIVQEKKIIHRCVEKWVVHTDNWNDDWMWLLKPVGLNCLCWIYNLAYLMCSSGWIDRWRPYTCPLYGVQCFVNACIKNNQLISYLYIIFVFPVANRHTDTVWYLPGVRKNYLPPQSSAVVRKLLPQLLFHQHLPLQQSFSTLVHKSQCPSYFRCFLLWQTCFKWVPHHPTCVELDDWLIVLELLLVYSCWSRKTSIILTVLYFNGVAGV